MPVLSSSPAVSFYPNLLPRRESIDEGAAQEVSSLYPQLRKRQGEEGTAEKVVDAAQGSAVFSTPSQYIPVQNYTHYTRDYAEGDFAPSAPPLEYPQNNPTPDYVEGFAPSAPSLDENDNATPLPQYVPVQDYMPTVENPPSIKKPSLIEQLTDAADAVANKTAKAIDTATEAAAVAGPAVATAAGAIGSAAVAVGKPVAHFALNFLRGVGSFLRDSVVKNYVVIDPEVARRRMELENRIQVLHTQYLNLECDYMEIEIREIGMVGMPALTGLVVGGGLFPMLAAGAVGYAAVKACRAFSRLSPMYKNKGAQCEQIRAEVVDLSATLGKKMPFMRPLFP